MSMCAWRLFNPFGGVSVVLFNGIIQLMRLGFILGILRRLIVVAWEAINDVINDENTWVIRQTVARFDKCWHICTDRLVRSFWPRPGFSYTTVDCLQLTFLCASAANPEKDKKKTTTVLSVMAGTNESQFLPDLAALLTDMIGLFYFI